MSLPSFLQNAGSTRTALLAVAGISLLLAALLYALRRARGRTPAAPGTSDAPLGGALIRSALLCIAAFVAMGLFLILLPERAFDGMTQAISARTTGPEPAEQIAFLYLGDVVKGGELHIRGAVRNITTKTIDALDASVRLYAQDRTLLETTVVRMNTDTIPPDAVATFHLTYPDYRGQFGSYSVDFKMRSGEVVAYKDMRGVRPRE